jgi:hypothetical protein
MGCAGGDFQAAVFGQRQDDLCSTLPASVNPLVQHRGPRFMKFVKRWAIGLNEKPPEFVEGHDVSSKSELT